MNDVEQVARAIEDAWAASSEEDALEEGPIAARAAIATRDAQVRARLTSPEAHQAYRYAIATGGDEDAIIEALVRVALGPDAPRVPPTIGGPDGPADRTDAVPREVRETREYVGTLDRGGAGRAPHETRMFFAGLLDRAESALALSQPAAMADEPCPVDDATIDAWARGCEHGAATTSDDAQVRALGWLLRRAGR